MIAPTFREALRYWLKLGLTSFGGPAGQISMMSTELVEKRRWISHSHFLHALNFCMLLPGPEAQQLATYLGWRLHGWRGGLAAGLLFILPSVLLLYFLSWLYFAGGHLPWLAALFAGLLPAVIAIVAVALLKIGRRVLRTPSHWLIAFASFSLIHFVGLSFVPIILGSLVLGMAGARFFPAHFSTAASSAEDPPERSPPLSLPRPPSQTWRRSLSTLLLGLTIWWLPLIVLAQLLGWQSTLTQQGLFFSKAALVTFGGAYAVLPYVAQQAVERFAWLSTPQMIAGLGLAETTPGPLVIVLQFVGFAGGWHHPGPFSPLLGATLGAAITTWATFAPCFLFIFLGAPLMERLRQLRILGAALSAVTAAVTGVMLNLAVIFTQSTIFPIPGGGPDWFVLWTSPLAFALLWTGRLHILPLLAACTMLNLLLSALA